MPVVSISAKALAMAAVFSAKKDVRPYLNGIALAEINGRKFVIGSDGHTAFFAHDPDAVFPVSADGKPLSIEFPALLMKEAKRLAKRGGGVVTIEAFDSLDSLREDDQTAQATAGGISALTTVYGFRGPDFSRILPDLSNGYAPHPGFFNAEYVARFAEVHKISGARYNAMGLFAAPKSGNRDSCMVVCPNIDAVGVIMPMTVHPAEWDGHLSTTICKPLVIEAVAA